MRLCFDMDGTITEGKYIEPPRTFEAYMSLLPYDCHTQYVYNKLALKHEIFIMTARSDHRADVMIQSWLNREGMMYPTAILTAIPQPLKWSIAMQLGCDIQIDDSPNVAETVYDRKPQFILMDNPHWKKNQEHESYPYIIRCSTWKDLGEIIEAIDIRELYKRIPRQ